MPAVAVRLFHQRSVKETVQFLSIPGVQYVEEGPTAATSLQTTGPSLICCPFLPSLHPMTSLRAVNKHSIMYVAVKLDDIIHR